MLYQLFPNKAFFEGFLLPPGAAFLKVVYMKQLYGMHLYNHIYANLHLAKTWSLFILRSADPDLVE